MNTNDLPPAAKLAALIEAGRAANPDLRHGRGAIYERAMPGEPAEACALGFACLGAGVDREALFQADLRGDAYSLAEEVSGAPQDLLREVWRANDIRKSYAPDGTAIYRSLDEVCAALREGEIAAVLAE
jgi:hypothetical protein